MENNDIIILDGPIGTILEYYNVDVNSEVWSGYANLENQSLLKYIYYIYNLYGAEILTTNTFRTTERKMGNLWENAVHSSIEIIKESISLTNNIINDMKYNKELNINNNDIFYHELSLNLFNEIDINKRYNENIKDILLLPKKKTKIAGSIAPLEDCWEPFNSPPPDIARNEHRNLARKLKEENVDLILCETFPNTNEALIAVEEALDTGIETWLSLTPGYNHNNFLLTPDEVRNCFIEAINRGVTAILLNCLPTIHVQDYLDKIIDLDALIGIYANAGSTEDGIGWSTDENGAILYGDYVESWIKQGVKIIGSCCGTTPYHIKEIKKRIYNI